MEAAVKPKTSQVSSSPFFSLQIFEVGVSEVPQISSHAATSLSFPELQWGKVKLFSKGKSSN